MAEMSHEFVANMIHSATGEDGLKYFPFVFTLFIFVLCSNFFGMVPGSFTVTSQIARDLRTGVAGGRSGDRGRLHEARHRLFETVRAARALPLLFLLVPIEVISFLTRPISLSVRLFANMLAGHTMLAVFAGFVVSLGAAGGILAVLAIAPMLLIVAIMLLELLVAFLQAYVFAILTCIYLNEALHLHDHH